MTNTIITVEALINAPVEKVWQLWTGTDHIVKWNNPSAEWHTPKAEHDLVPGGKFSYHMAARDGSMEFDFGGQFDEVTPNKELKYTIGDGRKVSVKFTIEGTGTRVVESFEAEGQNPVEMQRNGWQAIMNSFKSYVEQQ